MAFMTYSQESSLRPDKVYIELGDTLLAWKKPKTQEIAKQLIEGQLCDSINISNDSIIDSQSKEIVIHENKTILLNRKVSNLESQVLLKDKEILNLGVLSSIKDSEIKKQKKHKWVAIIVGGSLGVITILK